MQIVNSIVGLKTKRPINLKDLHIKCAEISKYNPVNFPGLNLKFSNPKATVLVFKSGSLVCTGTKNTEDVLLICDLVLIICDLPLCLLKFHQIHNYVGRGSFDQCLDLSKAYRKFNCRDAVFEPEIYPALTVKLSKYRVTVLLFSSGKFIITGSR